MRNFFNIPIASGCAFAIYFVNNLENGASKDMIISLQKGGAGEVLRRGELGIFIFMLCQLKTAPQTGSFLNYANARNQG